MRSLPLPLIRRLVPLNGLHERSLQALLDQSELQLIGRGQKLCSAADFSRYYFYILSGEAVLSYTEGEVVLSPEVLFPVGYGGGIFASAKTRTDCLVLRIDKQALDRQLCWDHVAAAIELDLTYQPEHDEEVGWRLTLLKSNLFLKVPPLNIEQIFSRLKPVQVKAGEMILRQGEVGEGCYFIRRGAANITRRQAGEDKETHIASIAYGRCFGEDALIYETVRNANVSMATDGLLMRLDKADFMLLLREPEVEHLKAADLDMALATGSRLLDIRTEDEFAMARLAPSENIPLAYLRLQTTSKMHLNNDYILCCDTGRRSRAAAYLLQRQGYRARYLLNGMSSLDQAQRDIFWESSPLVCTAFSDSDNDLSAIA